MDRKNLLASTRAEFLQAFQDAIADLIPRSVEHLFNKADHSNSSINQRRFLDARGVLVARGASLTQPLISGMEQLLNRSFQTAYNTFRPSFSTAQQGHGLALLDSSAFEDELRIDILTSRFRNEAEEQLRDLNIRIALLFEQDNIKERENPFRPYLFTRCIASVIETMGLSADLTIILTEQLAEELLAEVAQLYGAVNAHLARHGIAAQLQLKIKKIAIQSPLPGDQPRAGDAQHDSASDRPAADGGGNTASGQRAQAVPNDSPQRKIDQLMQSVRGRAFASAAAPAGAAKGGWLAGTHIVGDVLRKFFSGGGTGADSSGSYQAQAAAVPSAQGRAQLAGSIQRLMAQNTPAGEDMLDDDGEVRNLILEQRSSLNRMTGDISEQMTIDIVAMLFEFILRDNQVPAEVRAQLGRLQFLVLKIAMQDPGLLKRKSHPARMLVNRIGSISLGLKQLDPGGVRVTAEICRIVEALLIEATEEYTHLFAKMLDEFDAFVTRELLAGDAKVGRAVHIMEKAESRTLRFARITARIDEALTGIEVDPYLHHFLVNAWAHAIERAERTEVDGAKRFRRLIPHLLWSILPKAGEQDRRLLLALLPTLLPVLREGMALAGWAAEQQQLLNWLADAHAGAMRAHHPAVPSMSLSAVQQRFQKFVDQPEAEPQAPLAQGKAGFDSEFLDEAIRELEAQLHKIDQLYELDPDPPQQGSAPQAPADAPALAADALETEQAVLARLRSGIAIEINLGGTPGRGTLNWVSPSTSNLVLSIEGQDTPSVISVRLFRRLLANGRARFMEAAPLFERAVQSLLLSADQVDGSVA